MVQNQKINIYVQSTPTFARVFLVSKKSIVTHISFKIKILIIASTDNEVSFRYLICLFCKYLVTVIQHQFGSATSETRNRDKRRHGKSCHALLQYTIPVNKCCFVVIFSSILLFFFFFSGLRLLIRLTLI